MTKQIVIYTPAIRKKTSDFQTLRHSKSMETNQRLAEAYDAGLMSLNSDTSSDSEELKVYLRLWLLLL